MYSELIFNHLLTTKLNIMNVLLKPFWFIYLVFIFLPLAIILTILTAITTFIGCTLADHKFWGYYPGMIWSRLMCALIFTSVKVEGKENLDKNQSYVFAANHTSLYDIFVIFGFIGRPFKWVMKQEIRDIPFVGWACKAAGFIFINRKAMKQALHSMEEAKKTLSNGVSVVIFPEGTRTKTGLTGAFKRGAFKIAIEMNLPIVPVSISGAYNIWPTTRKYPIPGRLKMTIHKPVEFHEDQEHRNEQIESIRQTVISGIVKS